MKTELIYGLHAVAAALRYQPQQVQHLWLAIGNRNPRLQSLFEAARELDIRVQTVDRRELDRLSDGARHQGILARLTVTESAHDEVDLPTLLNRSSSPPLLLVLDGVQDPHNLGACLRTAEAAGVAAVVVPADRAAGLTSTVRKVAAGAAETVPLVTVTNLARTLRRLQNDGLWVIGAAGEAETKFYEADLAGPLALVLGAEDKGLRRLTREHCDRLIRIPMAGRIESLNVSVAAGVLLFEAVRQRSLAARIEK